jgi:hypothetical protein
MAGYASPLIEGMMGGVRIRQALAGLQDQERQAEVDDLKTRLMLESASRPIEVGTVGDITPEGPEIGGIRAPGMEYRRKPDASRHVKYKTRGGQILERELMTPEEQFGRALKQRLAEAQAMNQADIGKAIGLRREMLGEFGVDIPGMPGRYLPEQAATVLDNIVNQRGQQERAESQRAWQSQESERNRASREAIAAAGWIAANKRAEEANKTRIKAAGISAGARRQGQQLTPGQKGVNYRYQQNRFDKAMEKHDKLQAEEQEHWSAIKGYKLALEAGDKDTFIDPDDGKEKVMNELWRKSLKRRLDEAAKKTTALAGQQKSIRKQYETGEFAKQEKPEGRIRVKLPDGRTGTIDAAEFDEKTMQRL